MQGKQRQSRFQVITILFRKCRYCDEPITEKNANLGAPKALADICRNKDCQDLARGACDKILPCGHSCCGYRG